ncbi:MAG: membrane protein insertase YidC [Candidatus Nanopelagicales bacterium]
MDLLLTPLGWLENVIAWLLVMFHNILAPLFGEASGVTWVLSIVGIVIIIRILLIPLFVKQINAQRNMQLVQPQMKEIQKKYAGDRERQSQEMMKLYRETGTNPLSSCLPILLQAPIFFALFRVLQGIAQNPPEGKGALTPELAQMAHDATIFNVPIYATFAHAAETPAPTATRILAVVLIITMSLTTFFTQRQLMIKNTSGDNPMVKQMKVMMYLFPVIFAIGGFNFPIGVLIYWTTSNLWTMGQQFYVIRNNPTPGSPAAAALAERKQHKADRQAAKGAGVTVEEYIATKEAEEARQKAETVQKRQQPKRKSKKKRK